MKYTFLHVSDLHYRPDWPEENELVCNRFFDDLKTQVSNFENLHLIFSGDVVFSGGNSSFYEEFENNFGQRLDALGLPIERRICVPGNHDVSRDAIKPLVTIQLGSLSQIKDERSFNDTLPQLSKLVFANNFQNYKAYESKFSTYVACASGLGGAGWELGNGVAVYCLNTALCSFGGIDDANCRPISDQNRLMIDTRSLHKWLAENDCPYRLLVMHHPLDWLAPWARTELQKVIQTSFKVTFSGHVHEKSAVFSSQGSGGTLEVIAPPLFTQRAIR